MGPFLNGQDLWLYEEAVAIGGEVGPFLNGQDLWLYEEVGAIGGEGDPIPMDRTCGYMKRMEPLVG